MRPRRSSNGILDERGKGGNARRWRQKKRNKFTQNNCGFLNFGDEKKPAQHAKAKRRALYRIIALCVTRQRKTTFGITLQKLF